mmetsp:Transcript_7075/g.17925  ORF Transcript_7075/g.17925 Transcript_7075/m.17925 type:complete len:244 (-) Transcript_7075:294-1025(-)
MASSWMHLGLMPRDCTEFCSAGLPSGMTKSTSSIITSSSGVMTFCLLSGPSILNLIRDSQSGSLRLKGRMVISCANSSSSSLVHTLGPAKVYVLPAATPGLATSCTTPSAKSSPEMGWERWLGHRLGTHLERCNQKPRRARRRSSWPKTGAVRTIVAVGMFCFTNCSDSHLAFNQSDFDFSDAPMVDTWMKCVMPARAANLDVMRAVSALASCTEKLLLPHLRPMRLTTTLERAMDSSRVGTS